jgi:septum formation protein
MNLNHDVQILQVNCLNHEEHENAADLKGPRRSISKLTLNLKAHENLQREFMLMERIILASASPRRAELLRAAGIEFDVMPASTDETVHPGETPEAYVQRVAEAKATAVRQRANGRPVLAADTVVVVDKAILGKPVDRDDAKRMLRMLSGRGHQVLTSVTLLSGADPLGSPKPPCGEGGLGPRGGSGKARPALTRVETTTVEFVPLTGDEIDWYVATGEPDDKAGAYAIQGYASRFITRIDGSYSNVVGLPVALVYEMLNSLER